MKILKRFIPVYLEMPDFLYSRILKLGEKWSCQTLDEVTSLAVLVRHAFAKMEMGGGSFSIENDDDYEEINIFKPDDGKGENKKSPLDSYLSFLETQIGDMEKKRSIRVKLNNKAMQAVFSEIDEDLKLKPLLEELTRIIREGYCLLDWLTDLINENKSLSVTFSLESADDVTNILDLF